MTKDELAGVRAVICDVYGTLLQVGPPPESAAELWRHVYIGIYGGGLSLEEFNNRWLDMVSAENSARRNAGEPFPEVDWLKIVSTVTGRSYAGATPISVLHAFCSRRCTAMPGALEVIAKLRAVGVRCGIASNAQHYTHGELFGAGFERGYFERSLSFFSGEHGFAKPSPRVFALLNERLRAFNIEPHETLMIGDSLVNDIAPAAAAGWRTWHIGPRTWAELLQ
jgi:putative hydrolase of the HAD superfamily